MTAPPLTFRFHLLASLAEPGHLLHTGLGRRRHCIEECEQPGRSPLRAPVFAWNGLQPDMKPRQVRRDLAARPQIGSDELPARTADVVAEAR